jgi:mono/diheme cytochrome c family protein
VTVIDLGTGKELARVKVVREPLAAVATPDGRSVFVINHLPLERADAPDVAAVVTAIDTAGNQAQSIRLPNGSTGLRGLCLAPDGRYLYVVHILSRYQMPAVQLDRGWMNTNALTIIDVQAKRPLNTVLLDDVDLGAANPWGVAVSADGQTLCVSHAGTHELSVIDASGLLAKLARIAAAAGPAGAEPGAKPLPAGSDVSAAPAPADVPNDLAFLVGLRRRIHLEGSGPRGLALIGSRAYVAEYFSDSLGVVELEPKAVKPASQVALGPRPEPTLRRRGEMLFNDAEICFQHWQSCASCHPDGRVDGLNWDLTNDGLGNPKNTRSLVWVHQGGAAMALGVRPSAEAAVRAALTHILFAVRPEEEARALDAYLKSLGPVAGPHLVDGHLSPAGQRGMQLFSSPRVACDGCHPPPIYSDKRAHDVGSAGKLDKPTDRFRSPRLVEVWRTAPYLHDGHWLSVKELLTVGKHGLSQEQLGKLSERDIDDLVEFVLSL